MMGVVNKYIAKNIKISEEFKTVLLLSSGAHLKFPYTFSCEAMPAHLFFYMKLGRILWIDRTGLYMDKCAVTTFWVENDQPVLAVHGFMDQEVSVLIHITEDFKEKLAAYMLDNIINSD